MTRLPDAAWWNGLEFRLGEPSGQGGGFAMSREEMTELLRLAENMIQQINEQFATQREMVDFDLPALDPASAGYAGSPDQHAPKGARGVGAAYGSRLQSQADFLRQLIGKLHAALRTVEAADVDNVAGIRSVGPVWRNV